MPRYTYTACVVEVIDGVIEAPNKAAALKKAKDLADEQGCYSENHSVDLIKKADYDCYPDPE